MADLGFANDAGMQDGTGDGLYLDFLHKFMGVIGVRLISPLISQITNFNRLPAPCATSHNCLPFSPRQQK